MTTYDPLWDGYDELKAGAVETLTDAGYPWSPLTTSFSSYLATALTGISGAAVSNTRMSVNQLLAELTNDLGGDPVSHLTSSRGRLLAALGGVSGSPPATVGGWIVGAAGELGTMYEGYTLSWGHDFDTLDIVGPLTPSAPIFPTRLYGAGIRGNIASLGTSADVDPLTTGYNDSNRGVAVGFDNMSVSSSVLRLGARKATALEQAHISPTDLAINGGVRPQLSSMIHTGGACAFYPTTNAVIVEARIKFSSKANNPAGWHPSFWTYTIAPATANTGDEWDMECSSQSMYFEHIVHTAGVITSFDVGPLDYLDDTFHVFSFIFVNGSTTKMFVDGVYRTQLVRDSNTKNLPSFAMLTNHILNINWNGDTYSQAAWDGSATGAYIDVDYIRIARKTGVTHWTPLVSVSDLNVAYAGTGSVVLPSALTLWGDSGITEYVQVIPYDASEPGMADQTVFSQFPTGITYDSPSRTINVDFTAGTGKAGRSHVVIYGYKADGSTMEPLRFSINRGPKFTATTAEPSPDGAGGLTADLYYTADCGLIFPKSFSVSGLPAGWSFNATTSKITAASTSVSGGTISVTVTNGIGQQATADLELWSPAMISAAFTWDTTSATSTPNDGSGKVATLYDVYDATKCIAQTTTTKRPTISNTGGVGTNKRVMAFTSAAGTVLRSEDALATNAAGITSMADTADMRTGNLYVVFHAKETAISAVNRLLGWFSSVGGSFVHCRYTTTGRGWSIQGIGDTAQTADQATQDTNNHVFELEKAGASVIFRLDGTQVATLTITNTHGLTALHLLLGGANGAGTVTGVFNGSMGPGFVSTTIPGSSADKLRARQWVATRMGVTVV